MDVKDKIVIVTGASFGIGFATALLLAKHGARLSLAARSRDILNKLASELPDAIVLPTEMTDADSIGSMIEKTASHYGRIDILINNAGQSLYAAVEDIDREKYRYIIDLNVIGPLTAMQLVIPIMRKQGGGMIVNVSSGTSKRYIPYISAYASTKHALNAISLTARKELASENIIVSTVQPYITATNFIKNTIRTSKRDLPYPAVQRSSSLPPPDPPEVVAQTILEVIGSEKAEVFVHDWMMKEL